MSDSATGSGKARRDHGATRAMILDAARKVACRGGAREFSLRAVAAEAGFVPAALYGYFSGKNELLLALATEDLSQMARSMRGAASQSGDRGRLAATAAAALAHLTGGETIAAASGALPARFGGSEAERLFNGRLIAALRILSEAAGGGEDRRSQSDVILIAAALSGLALFARAGRLDALGFSPQEILARLDERFAPG